MVVGLRGVGFHRGDVRVVEADRALDAGGVDAAFVELHADGAGDMLLGLGDESLDGFALGGEPESVVDEFRVFRDERVAEVHDFAVHREGFHLTVSEVEDRAAGGFVNAAAFHADEAVLDHVHAADAVFAADFVEGVHHGERAEFFAIHGGAEAAFKLELDILGKVGSVFGQDGERGEILAVFEIASVIPRVFKDAGFVGDVEEIAIHRVGLLRAGGNGNAMGFGVGDHLGAAGEFRAEAGIAPRGDDFKFRREGGGGEFKADLVVAFAGGSVGHGGCALLAGDLNHALGNEGTGDAGAEKILSLVNRAGLHHRKNEISGELLVQVVHEALGGSGFESLLLEAVEFLGLADIGAEGDDLGSVGFLEPVQNDGGVESPGIRDNDFFHAGGSVGKKALLGNPGVKDPLGEGRVRKWNLTAPTS